MTRRTLREVVFKKLYEMEITGQEDIPEDCIYDGTYTDGCEDADNPDDIGSSGRIRVSEKECAYISRKAEAVMANREEIDVCIEEISNGWKVRRMSRVDLSILRLAVYEMLYDDDIPVGVAVNEAVEIAKKYGTDDSPSFINGILGNISRKKGVSS